MKKILSGFKGLRALFTRKANFRLEFSFEFPLSASVFVVVVIIVVTPDVIVVVAVTFIIDNTS